MFKRMINRRQFFSLFSGALVGVLASCSGPRREPDYTITIRRDLAFEPAALTIPIGSMVAWHHMAENVHTITADPAKAQMPERIELPEGAQPFDSGDLFAGQRWVHTFDVAGSYTYFCRYHEMDEMLGVITVTA
jgi:plastocyanin